MLMLSLPELLYLWGQMVAMESGETAAASLSEDTSEVLSHCCCFLMTICPLSLLLRACHPH